MAGHVTSYGHRLHSSFQMFSVFVVFVIGYESVDSNDTKDGNWPTWPLDGLDSATEDTVVHQTTQDTRVSLSKVTPGLGLWHLIPDCKKLRGRGIVAAHELYPPRNTSLNSACHSSGQLSVLPCATRGTSGPETNAAELYHGQQIQT